MAGIPILNLLKLPQLWRYVGFMSSVIGLVCYALSSSFKHLFGEWNLLKIFLYGVGSFSICAFMLFAKKWKLSNGFMLKAHVAFLVLMVTSVYSFFYDKAVKGKTDVLGLISCGAFAFMSFSLSRQMDLGFEVDLLNFFLGCLTVQLMKINLMLASIGVVFCYFLILLRSSLDSQAQQIGSVSIIDHVAVQVDAENQGSNNGFISGDTHHQQELPSLRLRTNDSITPLDSILLSSSTAIKGQDLLQPSDHYSNSGLISDDSNHQQELPSSLRKRSSNQMASAENVESEAATFLYKLIQDSKDEPAKMATKLYVILNHMESSGKEHSMPYQVISRAMETIINQHGLDIDALKSSRLPLTGGPQIGSSSQAVGVAKDSRVGLAENEMSKMDPLASGRPPVAPTPK